MLVINSPTLNPLFGVVQDRRLSLLQRYLARQSLNTGNPDHAGVKSKEESLKL